MEIPDPAVNPSWIPKPVMFAFVIFNLEKSIFVALHTPEVIVPTVAKLGIEVILL